MTKLKLWFADFWPNFYYDNNYFYYLLKTAYDVELDQENPDILFLSADPYRQIERDKYKGTSATKVFYTMEGVPPLFDKGTYPPHTNIITKVNKEIIYASEGALSRDYFYGQCDFALAHDVLDDARYRRFPYWAYQINWFDQNDYVEPDFLLPLEELDNNVYKNTPKTKFCAHIFNNTYQNPRLEIHKKLSEYKNVDGHGEPFGNSFYPWEKRKLEIYKDYKFAICFENSIREGYHTEKLFHAKIAGTLPIYWGHSSVSNDFNSKGFINLNDYESVDELVEYVKKIDQDDDLYNSYIQEPLFSDNIISNEFQPASVLEFFQNTILA